MNSPPIFPFRRLCLVSPASRGIERKTRNVRDLGQLHLFPVDAVLPEQADLHGFA